MPETARSKPLEIWFQDEARVGQQGTLTRIWAERGTRPRAPRDTRYIWSYIFGAVCPERAEAAALIMPHADTQAMSAHLAEIAKTVASGAHALLILDGAGWHGSGTTTSPCSNWPYSPELNPMRKCVGLSALPKPFRSFGIFRITVWRFCSGATGSFRRSSRGYGRGGLGDREWRL